MGQFDEDGIARRIVASIRARIDEGVWQPGERLPSTRSFAAEWGASRTTVTAAYGQLVAEGYITTRPGARAEVAAGLGRDVVPAAPESAPPRQLSAFARRLADLPAPAPARVFRIADFRYGDLAGADFPVLAWRRVMNTVLLRRPDRLAYGDPQGVPALRRALADYLWRARGIRCGPDRIIVVNGSQQALDLAARLLLDPGDRFVIENPGYLLARGAFAAAGGVAVPVPVDAEGLSTDRLPSARLAYVTPSHQFPLGGVLSAARRRALLAWARAGAALIVEDDYDGEYRHDVAPVPALQTADPARVIYVGTVSKTLSPTLRLGYLVVPADLAPAFAEARRVTDRHTALIGQEALALMLESGAYERHVRAIRRRNAARRAVLLDALAGLPVTVAGAATGLHLVVWLNGVPAGREAAVIAAAAAAGVGLYPVSALYDPAAPRPETAGLILGYAGLDPATIRRGVAVLARVLGR